MATAKEIEISAKLYAFLEKEGMEIVSPRTSSKAYITNKQGVSGYVYLTLTDVMDIVRDREEI